MRRGPQAPKAAQLSGRPWAGRAGPGRAGGRARGGPAVKRAGRRLGVTARAAAGRCGCWRWRRPPCWRGLRPRVSAGQAGGRAVRGPRVGARGSGIGPGRRRCAFGLRVPCGCQDCEVPARLGGRSHPSPQAGPQLRLEAWSSRKGPGPGMGRFQPQGASPPWFVFFFSPRSQDSQLLSG